MCELYQIPRKEAYALASLVVDIRVTQIVNLVKGAHAVLPHGAIKYPVREQPVTSKSLHALRRPMRNDNKTSQTRERT